MMNTLTEPRTMRIKQLKGNYLDEDYIRNFDKEWNKARSNVIAGIGKYERLYSLSDDFRWYIDCALENKDMTLVRVLSMRSTRMIAKIHAKEVGIDLSKPILEPPKSKKFTIWKESK